MIELRNVSKQYPIPSGHRTVLDGVTGVFPAGVGTAVLGGNGQGKSTLVRVLAGTESPDGGRVIRRGRTSFPLGFSGTFHPMLSGRENVRFLARLHGADVQDALDFAEDFSELGEYWHLPMGQYSSGMRARLGFGACLALDFDTYLVDEVIATGDERFRTKCLETFRMRAAGATLVLVTHDLAQARAFCTRGAVLSGGTLQFHDTLEEAIVSHERNARLQASAATGLDRSFQTEMAQ